MAYDVEIVEVSATPLAAISAPAEPMPGFARQIRGTLDLVYAFLRTHGSVRQAGHNVIVYDGPLAPGSRVTMGVQVDRAFEAEGAVLSAATPGGKVARTTHVGPYAALGLAHMAVVESCRQRGLALAGPAWEVYGDWSDDPAKLRTEVLHLLA